MILIETLPPEKLHESPIEHLALDWDHRKKHRQRCNTTEGTELALALPRGTVLHHGMLLHNSPERTIVVDALEEPVLVIRPADLVQTCKIAHHIGNWHRSMQVLDDAGVLTEDDAPLRNWLDDNGIYYVLENRRYQPNLRGDAHD
ncbi:MAG TPA: hypothetical protein V6C69_18460 [Trichormus sp.]